jgi:hypothetical protein
MIKLEFTLTLADFKAARALHRRQKLSRRLISWAGPILLVISIVGLVAGSLMSNLTLASQSFGGVACAIVLTVGMPIRNALSVRRSFNRLFHTGHKDRRSAIEIDDEHISRQLSGMSKLKVLWTGVYDFIQDDRVALIYTNKDCFLIIPSQAKSRNQCAELDSLIARHVVKR